MAGGSAADDGSVPLSIAQCEKQFWLLKVPPNVEKVWKSQPGGDLAKIVCTIDALSPDPQSTMEYTMELMSTSTELGIKAYTMNPQPQKDVIPSHLVADAQGRLAVEGKLVLKFDMKPSSKVQSEYRQMCRERDRISNTKTRTLRVISDDRGALMRPSLASSPATILRDPKRKAPVAPKGNEGKRTRRERGELEDLVFKLFERQPNWALKQLVTETDQPVAFLKEILNDLCTYNKRGTNQGTYELKPEYRRNAPEDGTSA